MAFLVFKADQRLENRRRSRVCGRDNRCNQADRLCDPLDIRNAGSSSITPQVFVSLVCIVNVLCCVVVLDDLVLYNTHASLSHCHLC